MSPIKQHHIQAELISAETFEAFLNEEMFARQPVSKFTPRVPKRLLKQNLSLFLEY